MAKQKVSIFLVDDDPVQNQMLTDHLNDFDEITVKSFETGEAMLKCLDENPDIVFLDYYLDSVDKNAKNGIEILTQLKETHPDIEAIMLSGQDKIEVAVETMKHGAFDYIIKNESSFLRAENSVEKITETSKLRRLAKYYKKSTMFLAISLVIIVILAIILIATGIADEQPDVVL